MNGMREGVKLDLLHGLNAFQRSYRLEQVPFQFLLGRCNLRRVFWIGSLNPFAIHTLPQRPLIVWIISRRKRSNLERPSSKRRSVAVCCCQNPNFGEVAIESGLAEADRKLAKESRVEDFAEWFAGQAEIFYRISG